MTHNLLLRRSQLVTPASSLKMIEKAAAIDCDSLILDLEDAVAPSMKPQARSVLRRALAELRFQGKELGVRVNGLDTNWFLDDLLALEGLPIDTVVIPKIHDAQQVGACDVLLRQLELRGGKSLTLQLLIESARGLENVGQIARASSRCVALIFGAGDFVADAGVAFTPLGLLYARSRIAAAAAAAGVQALDHVHPELGDDVGLTTQAREARELGFTGKWAIHPHQVPIINSAFSPSDVEIDEARRIITAYEKNVIQGTGAITVDGALVDEATLKIMRRRQMTAKRMGLWECATEMR